MWERKGRTEDGQPWFIRYTFGEKDFEVTAQPALHRKGTYSVGKEVESLLILQLYNVVENQTFFIPFTELPIAVDRRNNCLTIDDKLFRRV